jgi:hypothetical protein
MIRGRGYISEGFRGKMLRTARRMGALRNTRPGVMVAQRGLDRVTRKFLEEE